MKLDIADLIQKIEYDPNSVKKNYDGKTDVYLAKASYRYAYFKRIILVALLIAIILFLLSGNLSYSKFYYLTKDIKLANDYVTSVHNTITYNAGNSQSFATYRGGLAVASREKLSIFSAGGRELFSSNHSYGNPALVTSDKYVLLHDVGGKQYALYNSFSKVSEGTLDYAIYGASIAQNGTFALITKSENYSSVVSVYLQNGTKYDYNFSSGYVTAISLSQNGSQMAVVLSIGDGDELVSVLRVYKVGSDDYNQARITFKGIPYAVKIFNGKNVCVLGAHGANAFSSNLNLLGEYFCDEEIYFYTFGEDNIALCHLTDENSKTKIVVLNRRGKTERTIEQRERVLGVALYGDYLFTQQLGGFERTNLSLNITDRVDLVATDFKIISYDKDTLIVCNDSYARFLTFGK